MTSLRKCGILEWGAAVNKTDDLLTILVSVAETCFPIGNRKNKLIF
nr:MAG TPA: hypothetical protein [Caudoviricetes sp.]